MRKISNQELGRPSAEAFAAMEKCPVTVVLDDVRSGNNTGSFFPHRRRFRHRTALPVRDHRHPPDREIHKTALGAETTVEWTYFRDAADAVNELKAQGYTILAVEQVEGAVMLDDWRYKPEKRYALVFGNEVNGVRQQVVDLCDGAIEIPQRGTKHSLNVSVSGGVVLWEVFRQWRGIESGTVTGGDTETKSVRKNEKSLPVANYNFTFALSKL